MTSSGAFEGSRERAVITSEPTSAIKLRHRVCVVNCVNGAIVNDEIVDPPVLPPTPPRLSVVGGSKQLSIRAKAQRDSPLVRVDHDLDLTADDACRQIVKHPNVYQRNQRLVEVLEGKIRDIPPPIIRERLTSVGTFMGTEKRGAGERAKLVPRMPSDQIVQSVYLRGNWGARPLSGVTDTPIVRRNGTIVQTPGYDALSKFVYAPNVEYPAVEDNPSMDLCHSELRKVLAPISAFPWRLTPTGRSPSLASYISLLLTTMLVSTIDGNIPGYIISANVRGTGKTKLMQIASVIATGNRGSTIGFVDDDDEVRKRIAGSLQSGSRLIMFDNVRRRISGDAVDMLLTTRSYEDRILGRTENVCYDNNSITIWTGNNLEVDGDTVRRVMPIDIECTDANPETRKFGFDPVAIAIEDRPVIVSALLTMIRGWYAHGCPRSEDVVLGSFEEWSSIVPQILIWLGLTNPIDARSASSVVVDRTLKETFELAEVWDALERDLGASNGLTVGQVIRALYPDRGEVNLPNGQTYRYTVEGLFQKIGRDHVAKELTSRLRTAKKRVLDTAGRSFDVDGMTHGLNRWSVRVRS